MPFPNSKADSAAEAGERAQIGPVKRKITNWLVNKPLRPNTVHLGIGLWDTSQISISVELRAERTSMVW
jgi:hypothetical protein